MRPTTTATATTSATSQRKTTKKKSRKKMSGNPNEFTHTHTHTKKTNKRTALLSTGRPFFLCSSFFSYFSCFFFHATKDRRLMREMIPLTTGRSSDEEGNESQKKNKLL